MANYTINFGPEFERMLNHLSAEKNVSKSEIIRRAIATYEYLSSQVDAQEGKQKNKVSITSQNDEVLKDVVLP